MTTIKSGTKSTSCLPFTHVTAICFRLQHHRVVYIQREQRTPKKSRAVCSILYHGNVAFLSPANHGNETQPLPLSLTFLLFALNTEADVSPRCDPAVVKLHEGQLAVGPPPRSPERFPNVTRERLQHLRRRFLLLLRPKGGWCGMRAGKEGLGGMASIAS